MKQLISLVSTQGKSPAQVSQQVYNEVVQHFATKLGLTKCPDCGEYVGQTVDDGVVVVNCICHGTLCSRCGLATVHRPISNYFDVESKEIVHVPHFKSLCADCVLGIRA